MLKKVTPLVFLFLLVSNWQLFAQEDSVKEELKLTIDTIHKLVDESKFIELCKYLMFRDFENPEGSGKRFLNAKDEMELTQALMTSKLMKEEYFPYKTYSYVKFFTQKKDDGSVVYAWQINYVMEDTEKLAYFGFQKVGDRYLLVDID